MSLCGDSFLYPACDLWGCLILDRIYFISPEDVQTITNSVFVLTNTGRLTSIWVSALLLGIFLTLSSTFFTLSIVEAQLGCRTEKLQQTFYRPLCFLLRRAGSWIAPARKADSPKRMSKHSKHSGGEILSGRQRHNRKWSTCTFLDCRLRALEGCEFQDFPGSPAVKTPCFQCWRHGLDPRSGN